MRWLKRDVWKIGSIIAGMLFLFVLMMWLPMSATSAHEGTLAVATPTIVTVQATPTEDATVTARSKEKLAQEVNQLKNQNFWSFWTNFATPFSILVALVAASFGFWRWRVDRRDAQGKELKDRRNAQDKDLKDKAEERFKTAVAALGDEKEGTQVGGAILLRSFLNPDDKKNYERYYTQVFDLAVAYLRLPRTSYPSENPDGIPYSPESPPAPLPLASLSQALIIVFKEAFPLARDARKRTLSLFNPRSLDATRVQLDGAYLAHTDLSEAWLREVSLRDVRLADANLSQADLRKANLTRTDLTDTCLKGANLRKACLGDANFLRANLEGADLSATNLRGANLSGANLSRVNFLPGGSRGGRDSIPADLSGANPEAAQTLEDTDLRWVTGLTKEQLAACKAKGAIIDENLTASSSQSTAASPPPEPRSDVQATSALPTQGSLPASDASESSAVPPQQEPES